LWKTRPLSTENHPKLSTTLWKTLWKTPNS
jgi:hypothetical protein